MIADFAMVVDRCTVSSLCMHMSMLSCTVFLRWQVCSDCWCEWGWNP